MKTASIVLGCLATLSLAQGPAVPVVPAPVSAAQVSPAAQAPPDAQPRPATQPYGGTWSEGQTELQRLSKGEEHEDALALARALEAKAEHAPVAEPRAAELFYAIGVAHGRAQRLDETRRAFARASALAGPGELRLDALYDVGAYQLLAAEEVRELVPEVRQKKGLPPLSSAPAPSLAPPVGSAAPGAEPQSPDPLEVAEAAYREARGSLVVRLRAGPMDGGDGGDEATRANLELIQRRLRELEEIRAQREQEQQEQQQEQQEKQDPEQKEQEQQGGSEKGQEPKDSPEDSPKDSSGGEQQEDGSEPQESEPKEGEDAAPKPEEQPGEESEETRDAKEDKGSAGEGKQSEKVLSFEEVQRLFDQLAKIEEQARAVKAMLQERRRKPVEKDW